MATAVNQSTNGATSAAHYAPTGHVEIDPVSVHVEATFSHPDIVLYAENGGLGLDPLASVQALLVAGINASRSAGAYALAQEARQAAESLRTVLLSESEAHVRSAVKRAMGQDGEEGAFLPEVERIVSGAAKAMEAQALQMTKELKGAGEDGLPQLIEKRVRRAASDVVESILKAALASDGALGVHLQNNGKAIKELRE